MTAAMLSRTSSLFSYGVTSLVTASGKTISPMSLLADGAFTSFSVEPALPEGLTLDEETGEISGSAKAVSEATYTVHGENPKGAYGQNGRKAPVTRMAVAATLRGMLFKAKRYAQEVEEAEKDETKTRPFDMQLEALLPVIRKEIPLKAHAHRADDILTAIRIAKEFDVDITLDHVTEGHLIVNHLVQAGKPVLVGPSFGSKSKQELKEKSFATAGILDNAGLEVCIITDAPVIPLYYLPLCAGLAVKAGMKEESAWRAITINPAHVVGIDSRVGSLEAGKDADIAIFEGNPLRDIQCCTKAVYVNGEEVLKKIKTRV